MTGTPATPTSTLLEIDSIYHEPGVTDFARGGEIFDRFSDAARIEVPSHWNIPTAAFAMPSEDGGHRSASSGCRQLPRVARHSFLTR